MASKLCQDEPERMKSHAPPPPGPLSTASKSKTRFEGALVRRQRGPGGQHVHLAGGNPNRLNETRKSRTLTDEEVIDFLKSSGKVDDKELCSYITPEILNNQDERIARIIDAINVIINNMAQTRRILLYNKLTKRGIPTEDEKMKLKLLRWPVQVCKAKLKL